MVKTVIAFIIIFGVLVFVHEFGHYFFARRAGILVREFSIGVGPKLFAFRRGSTTFTIRILPLGGYVRLAGLEDDQDYLQKGMPIVVALDDNNHVVRIDASKKHHLMTGMPLEVTAWDLEKELWLEGYTDSEENNLRRLSVDHDATIIEADGTELQIAPLDVQFQSASVMKRIITNAAGAFNNFLLAIIAFFLIAVLQGGVASSTNQVAKVMPHSVAADAGIKANDRIIRINGDRTATWDQVATAIGNHPGKKITITVQRKHDTHEIAMTPQVKIENGRKTGIIGITAKLEYDRSPGAIIGYGFKETATMVATIFSALGRMFTHGVSLNDFGGPVAMYSYTSEAAQYGVLSVVGLLAVLSVNLGVVNLLPIPALDGGKILLNIIEGVRGKPLDPEKEGLITMIGFGFLLLLMILVTWNDFQWFFLH